MLEASAHSRPIVLVHEPEHPAELDYYRAGILRCLPESTVHLAATHAEALRLAANVDVLMLKGHRATAAMLDAMPRLQFIQALTTGVDALLQLPLKRELILCSGRGIHGPQMSELAILYMISLLRDFPRMLRNQDRSQWQRWPQRLLRGKSVAIVGIGTISNELASHCKAFGMRVVGLSNALTAAPHFDEVLPRSALHEVAARIDFLVLLVPYNAETHHLADERLLQAMRPGSFLINIARGRVVDERALVAALRSGALAGAALDVFDIEPLDAASPLWTMPNVIVTPHIGGMSDCYAEQLMPLIENNLRAYAEGRPTDLLNVVTR